jgi:hypothetical protein
MRAGNNSATTYVNLLDRRGDNVHGITQSRQLNNFNVQLDRGNIRTYFPTYFPWHFINLWIADGNGKLGVV